MRFKKSKMKLTSTYVVSIAILIIAIILTIVLAIVKAIGKDTVKPVDQPISSQVVSSQQQKPPTPAPATVRLLGVGDNLIHEGIYNQAHKRAGGVGYDFTYAYQEMQDIISQADIASINQETMLASIFAPSSYPMFNSPQELGKHMLKLGFDVFNQANNHSIDKGAKGIISTLDFWETQQAAKVVGVYRNQQDADHIRTVERNGVVFSFLGMTELTNGLNLPKDTDIVLERTMDEERIQQQIKKAKTISDVVVVNAHWGVEYTNVPNETQKALAKKMITWGADIILGHHPHVIQPVEYVERPDGSKGVVCYSLGNFISAQEYGPRMIGGMLDVTVEKNFETKKIELKQVHFLPVVTHYGANYTNIKVYPLSKYTKELASSHGVRTRTKEFNYDYIEQLVKKVINSQFLTSDYQ
ncbi:CapA family protein [Paludicola sp. MB14-C6]|uniref:CapA family protein n=1 Tax=Paludihabitans sp. MB14-C6 TaxID=3070656 RepID=UPI0027DBCEDC|nr:CapA family protein [Paludicola sp. MB14-C6]WMJ23059.1 CapA family protein [Paludicola sp. MB14-C6]